MIGEDGLLRSSGMEKVTCVLCGWTPQVPSQIDMMQLAASAASVAAHAITHCFPEMKGLA